IQGFGPEPAHRPVTDRIAAGHRAVRRRGIVGVVVTGLVASVVGLGAVAVLGDGGDTPARVATDPTVEPTAEPAAHWDDGELARFDAGGHVEIRPGATVLDRVDEPYGN